MKEYIDLDIESSYKKNNIGKTLYNFVLNTKPEKIIEFGCLYGYSTIAMALALKKLNKGNIICYDIFDKYQYTHSTFNDTMNNIKKHNVQEYVSLEKMDFYTWLKAPEDFDLIHIDISNNGDIILDAYNSLYDKLKTGSCIIFEGGSEERDNIDWMIKYEKRSINSIKNITNYEILNDEFPSLSKIKL